MGPRSGSFAGSAALGAVLPAARSRSGGETSCAVAQVTLGVRFAPGRALCLTAAEPLSAAPAQIAAARRPVRTASAPARLSAWGAKVEAPCIVCPPLLVASATGSTLCHPVGWLQA